ncbi:MAG: hypothetical protein QY308_03975 [Ignavibacteriaceae bacterium]|nr:MAG: hypothetical protein QY308_03975 [Ignavibacteriaceae bacterium]
MKEETLAALLDEQYSITELPEIDPGSLINLSGFQYKIIEPIFELNIIPDGFYYKAIGEDSKNYIIKFSFKYKNPAYEPKPSVHTLLTSLSHEGLAKSKEFATGIKKYKFKYCYEVYEVDTDIVPLMFVDVAASAVKHSLLPQLKDLIEYLHKNDVFLPYLHICNLFVKPGEKPKIILLGYGHAMSKSKFPVVEKSSFSESNLCRFFLAPEVMEGLYSTTSDYYSLGMILLWIFYPDTFSKKNFTAILQNSKELKPIIEYKPELYEVNLLIEGLTLHEELNRFTAAQLNDIMAGKQVLPLYYGKFYLVKHPKGNEKLHNIGDLVVFIQSQPDKFKKHLSHPADLQAFTEWVSSLDGVKNSASLKGYLIRYKNYPVDFLSEIILRVLIPGRPLKIGGNEYSLTEPSEYKETASDFFRHLEHVHFYDKGASLDFELYRFLLACRELYNSDTKKYPVLNDTFNRALEILELEPDVFDEEFAKKTINITQKKWAFLFHFHSKQIFQGF